VKVSLADLLDVRGTGLALVAALGCTALGCILLGCNPGGDGVYVAPAPVSAGGSSSVASAGSGATDEAPIFNGETPPPPAAPPDKCDKVDFLYVVDNSQSMNDKQETLARSFDGFSRIVEQTLGTNDHQIMVIDTDADNINDTLNARGQTDIDPCIGVLGAGLRVGSEGESCDLQGPQHYMLNRQPDPASAFACLARVGIFGDDEERPVDALLAATGAASPAVAECNGGFLRDDAVLVVTIITDEEDDQSAGDPAAWKEALLRAKGGNEESIVMLGLVSDSDVEGGLPGGPCDPDESFGAPRLRSFVSSFERGSLGSICASDFSSFFAQAVSVIDTACQDFVPVVR
jgi:hypothetical protein